MIFRWETDKERTLRFMRIPARKKLEWLYQINEFIHKFSSKKQEKIRQRLRRI
jgi:hypothetical protein